MNAVTYASTVEIKNSCYVDIARINKETYNSQNSCDTNRLTQKIAIGTICLSFLLSPCNRVTMPFINQVPSIVSSVSLNIYKNGQNKNQRKSQQSQDESIEIVNILGTGAYTYNIPSIDCSESNTVLGEMDMMKSNISILKEFKMLKENWDCYGAKPFSKKLIDITTNIIENIIVQPEIFPTGRGSIQLEYEEDTGRYLELEIFEDYINVLFIDEDGNETESVISNEIDEVNKVVSKFYGRKDKSR